MKKSVYSIVLSDRVVEMLDAFAYREGISRSAAINRILAEHLSMITPEQQMRDVLAAAQDLLCTGGSIQLLPTLSEGLLMVKAPLRFKYNPTVRYSVELHATSQGTLQAELRAAARTQSEHLLGTLDDFFSCFSREARLNPAHTETGGGRFSTRFALATDDVDEAGRRIASLVGLMQKAMSGYFEHCSNPYHSRQAVQEAAAAFRQTINQLPMEGSK